MKFASDQIASGAALRAVEIGVLDTGAGGDRDLRAIAGESLRYVLVSRPDQRPLRVELWIALIGANQRRLDGIGERRHRARERHQKDRSRSSGKVLHPSHSVIRSLLFAGSKWNRRRLILSPQHRTRQSGTELPCHQSRRKLFTWGNPATLLIQNGILTDAGA